MYLYASMTIDPQQLTEIARVKPTKGFARLANVLTAGLVNSKEEWETFSAVTILQQINIVLRSLGVDNIIRLAKDETVFFEDTVGIEGDLKKAFEAFTADEKPKDVSLFNRLSLVVQHQTQELGYLIDIRIDRTHQVGKHPIRITINAFPKELSNITSKENWFEQTERDAEELNAIPREDCNSNPLQKVFDSQDTYDSFIARYNQTFTSFLDDMEAAFKKHMEIDYVSVTSAIKIIRPKKRVNEPDDVPYSDDGDPVFRGYRGTNDDFFYAWLWVDHCHSNDIRCHDCIIVDSEGTDVLSVGEEGFQSGEGTTMDVDASFGLPENDDTYCLIENESEYSAEITRATFEAEYGDDGGGDGGGGGGDGGGDGGGGGGGCGGGCGGCGG